MHTFHITITYGAFSTKAKGPNAHHAIKAALENFAVFQLPDEIMKLVKFTATNLHAAKRGLKFWTKISIVEAVRVEVPITVSMERI